MAKPTSILFKFKGTIGELTFVNSVAYDPHVRRSKGSVTPVVLTGIMKENETLLPRCNELAQQIFHPLKPEPHDGKFWSRIVQKITKETRSKGAINLTSFLGHECNVPRKMSALIGGYNLQVHKDNNILKLTIQLQQHPVVNDKIERLGYRLRFVAVFPDFTNKQSQKEIVQTALIQYTGAPQSISVDIPMPSADAPYLVCLSFRSVLKGSEDFLLKEAFLKVIAAE